MNLRDKVQWVLDNKEITTYELSNKFGITLSNVQKLRKGESSVGKISLDVLEKYARAYDELAPQSDSVNNVPNQIVAELTDIRDRINNILNQVEK